MFNLSKYRLFGLSIVVVLTAAVPPARLHGQAGPDVSCADANGDAVVNLSDVVSILDYLFLGKQELMCRGPVLSCGDVNADDEVNLSDAVWLLQWLFLGGPAPLCVGGAVELEGFTLLGTNDQGFPEYRHEETGIVFVLLPGGTLSPFLIAKYEVTQGEWEAVMGENPSDFQGDQVPPGVNAARLPVEEIWWFDMERFCRKTGFTLPTAEQWIYAEAHSETENLDDIAWHPDNSGRRPHEVGTKQANQFGLHDMLGSVWEVTRDRRDSVKGGSFLSGSSFFVFGDVDGCYNDIGFRLVRPFHQEIELHRDWLAPGRLDFGYVVLGHSSSLRLDIQNLGALPLELERITLSPQTSSEFEIEESPGAVLIPPGESVQVKILYTPVEPGETRGTLVIESNDADEGSRNVPVHGAGSEATEALDLELDLDDFTSLGPNDQGYPEYRHDDTGIVFVLLPGGTFWMGAQSTDPDGRNYDPDASETEQPVHEVTLSPFLIAKYEVTQGEWEAVMGENPSTDQGAWLPPGVDTSRLPVDSVSWLDVQRFEEETEMTLPTEAQWEYACRAGTEGAYSGTGIPGEMGWLARLNSGVMTHIVGGKQPNQFGLHDMHGNVSEWCEDVWDRSFYSNPDAAGPDPISTTGSDGRVFRGGNTWILPLGLGHRTGGHEWRGDRFTGFRPAWPLRQ